MFVYFLSRESYNLLVRTARLFYLPNTLRGLLILQIVLADLFWLEAGSFKRYWSDKN